MFNFGLVTEPKSRAEVFQRIREDLHADYEYMIKMMEKGEGMLVPILLKYCSVSDESEVRFIFSDDVILCERGTVDKFCFVYREEMTVTQFANAMFASDLAVGNFSFWEACREEEGPDQGQAKIMLATLYPLCGDTQRVNILYIGSSSDDTIHAGRTCETLIEFLDLSGRSGSIVMYDPYERTVDFVKGSFMVSMRGRKFDYSAPPELSVNGEPFTHIYDDVWVPTLTREEHDPIEYDEVKCELKDGYSRFAYRIVGQHKKYFHLKNGLEKHRDLEGAIGGGWMLKRGPDIVISGTSQSAGPYVKKYVSDALSAYHVTFVSNNMKRGRLTFDPDSSLFKNYPNAIISAKHYGEDLPVQGQVRSQAFYSGLETRIVLNSPVFLPSGYRGCGCRKCVELDVVYTNFHVYSGVVPERFLDMMIGSVIHDKCTSAPGTTFAVVSGYWITAARLYGTYEDALKGVTRKYNVSESYAERAFRYVRNQGKVDTRGVAAYMHPARDYTVPHVVRGQLRWYRPRKFDSDYVVKIDGAYKRFDSQNNDVTRKMKAGTLVYRRNLVEATREDVVHYFVDRFGSQFVSVTGYDVEVSGRYPCGFDLSYYYAIVRDPGDYYPIDSKDGWYLVRTVM